jgi:hypothetical protein
MGLVASDFEAATLRCVFFTQGIAFETKPALAALVRLDGLSLDGEIVSLPFPAEAPPQVPRLQMAARDRSQSVEAGPERFSFAWQIVTQESTPPQQFVETAVRAFAAYREALPSRLVRVALHIMSFASSQDPAMALALHFCKPEWLRRDDSYKGALSRCENFELHAHKRFPLNSGVVVNSWMRCKTGQLTLGGVASNGVVADQDINTLAEDAQARNLENEEATRLFREMLDESSIIINSYFPVSQNASSEA